MTNELVSHKYNSVDMGQYGARVLAAVLAKFNPYHGPDGRFSSVEGAGQAGVITQGIFEQGGFSYNLGRGKSPKTGYMVSPYKDAEAVFDVKGFSSTKIGTFISQHKDRLRQPDHYLGAWEYEGKVYLDISVRRKTQRQAMEIARGNDQIAIFDVARGRELITNEYWERQGGKAAVAEPGGRGQVTFGAPADESLEAFRSWVLGTMGALGLAELDDMSEAEWIASWVDFWS